MTTYDLIPKLGYLKYYFNSKFATPFMNSLYTVLIAIAVLIALAPVVKFLHNYFNSQSKVGVSKIRSIENSDTYSIK